MRVVQGLFIVVVLGLSLLSPNLFSIPERPERSIKEYWQDVGLKSDILRKYINETACYQKIETFLACAYGINALFAAAEDKLVLITDEIVQTDPDYRDVVHDFGQAKIVRVTQVAPDDEESFIEFFRRLKEERLQIQESWRRLFNGRSTPHIFTSRTGEDRSVNFDELLTWASKKEITSDNESYLTADAINTTLSVSIDPHTYIIPKTYFDESMSQTSDTFSGIGAYITKVGKKVVIASPIEGSPALRAGLKANDVITHIDGESVEGWDVDKVTQRIRGERETQVHLTIQRGEEHLEITVTRDKIVLENVSSKIVQDRDHPLAYVKLTSFVSNRETGESSHQKIRAALRSLNPKTRGIIFDLRENGGGYLDQAISISSLFLPTGRLVVTQRDLSGTHIYSRHPAGIDEKYINPMIVLINAGSASASEIVSGALQDHERALIIGDRSFGKGSVQEIRVWPEHRSVYLAETVRRFYLPSGRTNQIQGVVPDLTVPFKPHATEEEVLRTREEDSYINALPHTGDAWIQPRPELVARLKSCADETGQAEKLFNEHLSDAIRPDYQLLYAQDVMSCLLK